VPPSVTADEWPTVQLPHYLPGPRLEERPLNPLIFVLENLEPFVERFPLESGLSPITHSPPFPSELPQEMQGPIIWMASGNWEVGDPIDQLDKAGNYPSWETVRSRYWRNRADTGQGEFGSQNIARMEKGYAPVARIIARLRDSGEGVELLVSKELHHKSGRAISNPHSIDKLMELWPWEHEEIDPSRHLDYDFARFK
jgi:hypothetical protein